MKTCADRMGLERGYKRGFVKVRIAQNSVDPCSFRPVQSRIFVRPKPIHERPLVMRSFSVSLAFAPGMQRDPGKLTIRSDGCLGRVRLQEGT